MGKTDLADPTASLRAGLVDVTLTRTPFDTTGVATRILRAVPVAVILRADPPAARSAVSASDLTGRRWVRLPGGTDPAWTSFWTGGPPDPAAPVLRTIRECLQAVTWNATAALASVDQPLPTGLVALPLSGHAPSSLVVAWPKTGANAQVRGFVRIAADSQRARSRPGVCEAGPMQLGLHALGIGAGARRAVIDAVAVAAEACGFATLWSGEHVVMVDHASSRYPYSPDGRIAVPAAAHWLDPLVGLSFAAAATSTIRVATGVLLLPEHNPIVVAKQAASLDVLSGGRLTLGVGVGWSREEFDALGVPFARRTARTEEYVAAMRALWREDVASFTGDFVRFDSIRVNPKPCGASIPIIFGGNSDAALRRAATLGDGWYGFNLDGVPEVADRLAFLAAQDRDVAELRIAVALRDPEPDDVEELAALGVDELVIVDSPPEDLELAADWVSTLAARWLPTAAGE